MIKVERQSDGKGEKRILSIECDTERELDHVIEAIKREAPNTGVFVLFRAAVKEATE